MQTASEPDRCSVKNGRLTGYPANLLFNNTFFVILLNLHYCR